jgi:hypothetical protein
MIQLLPFTIDFSSCVWREMEASIIMGWLIDWKEHEQTKHTEVRQTFQTNSTT